MAQNVKLECLFGSILVQQMHLEIPGYISTSTFITFLETISLTIHWSKTYMNQSEKIYAVCFLTDQEKVNIKCDLVFPRTSCIQSCNWLNDWLTASDDYLVRFYQSNLKSLNHSKSTHSNIFSIDILFVGRRCHTSKADEHGTGHCSRAPVHYRYKICS